MSLLETQNFLARVYTDENLRREFLSAPEKTGRENNLNAKEIAELAKILPEELSSFAESLLYKRLREVEKLLPLSRQFLDGDFEINFREFANQFLPETTKKHLEDTLQFAEFMLANEKGWRRDLIKFESAKLKFYGYEKWFVFRTFNHNIKKAFRRDENEQRDFNKQPTLAVWIRFGKKTFQFIY